MIVAILILALVLIAIVHEWTERKQSKTINAANNNLYIARKLK